MSRRAILRGRLWLLLLAVGLASSVAGIAVDVAIGLGRELRHGVLAFGGHTLTRFVLWVAWSVGLTCLAVWLGRESTAAQGSGCLSYTSPSPRDKRQSRMPSSA